MKRTICAAAVVAMSAASAVAADMQRPAYYAPAPAALPGAFAWMGPYAGLNLGYQWATTSNSPTDPSGIAGGAQLGYNWQSGQFVYGVETDFQVSGADDTVAPVEFTNPWWGTLRGRGGYLWNNFLLYATLGLAYGDVKAQTAGLTETKTHLGWAGGAGVEVALNTAWSAKAEYLYVDLDKRGYTVTGTRNGLTSNMLRFGVNYHF